MDNPLDDLSKERTHSLLNAAHAIVGALYDSGYTKAQVMRVFRPECVEFLYDSVQKKKNANR